MANTSIKLYSFTKKENSTATVSGNGTDVSGVMLDNTSILTPRFRLSLATTPNYNYAYISDFGRYYFITDWEIDNGFWVVSMKVDVLATFKSTITGGTHYVLRAASDSNEDIVDTLYPTIGTTDLLAGSDKPSVFDSNEITAVIGLINSNQTNKFGAVQYYAMTGANIGILMNYLLGGTQGSTTIFQDILTLMQPLTDPDVRQSISRSIIDPAQYITESFLLPYTPPLAVSGQNLKAGWFNVPVAQGDIISSGSAQFSIDNVDLELPGHPQAATRGKYLTLEPFMRYWLYLGPFGVYPVDSSMVYDNRTITVAVYGDLMGNVTAKLRAGGQLLDVLHANVKCNFPVAQTTMDVSRAVGAGSQVALSAARIGMGDAGGIISGISGIASAAEAALPKLQTQSSQGTFINVFDNFTAYGAAHYIADEMNAEKGRPLCESVQLSTLTGYCLCSGADVAISGTAEEAAKINDYLNTGFFIE